MFSPRHNPLATCLLLAAYLAASTFSGLFHDHGCCDHDHDGQAGHARCQHVAGDHEHGTCAGGDCEHAHQEHANGPCDHDHGPLVADHDDHSFDHARTSDPHGKGPLYHDDCPVCRFIGQRVMPVAMADVELSQEFHVELAEHCPSQPVFSLARTTHSRAPPLLG